MLQFNATLCAAIVKSIPKPLWRVSRLLSSATNPHEQAAPSHKDVSKTEDQSEESHNSQSDVTFQKLTSSNNTMEKPHLTDTVFKCAKSVNEYLELVQNYQLSKQDTFKIMSAIMKFINDGDIKIENMLTDTRFEKLQQMIVAMDTTNYNKRNLELADKYSTLSTVEMIKVLGNMVKSGEKNIDAVRYLTDHITQYNATLTPEQCKQLLSYMVSLNFHHKVLANKICRQLINNSTLLNVNIIEQIATSLGLLKYKDSVLLDVMCTHMLYCKQSIAPKDLSSFLLTLATLGYSTPKVEILIKKHIHPLVKTHAITPTKWLNLVWSLVVLNMAEKQHYESILQPEFLNSLSKYWTVPNKLKLLNIKASAEVDMGDSLGTLNLSPAGNLNINAVPSQYRKKLTEHLCEAMKEVVPSEAHYKINVNTDMGFSIDAVCYINEDGEFVTEDSPNIKNRLAVILLTLAEYTRGEGDPIGIINLWTRLLKAKGYHVVEISEKFFSPVDTAAKRLFYVNDQIRRAINLSK